MSKNKSSLNKFKPISDDFEFRNFPFYWLSKVANVYSLRMEKALKKAKLNTTAWRILMILREHGNLSVSDIAKDAVVKTPTITKAAYKMQDEGLLAIATSEEDARVSIVSLTEKGQEAIVDVIKNTEKVFEDAYDDLSAAKVEQLKDTLQKLFINLEHH